MNGNIQSEIDRLDLAYQKLCSRKFRTGGIVTGREQGWAAFINAGFTVADLETVILWIKGKILAGIYHEPRLAWRRLIADLQLDSGTTTFASQTCRNRNAEAKASHEQGNPRQAQEPSENNSTVWILYTYASYQYFC